MATSTPWGISQGERQIADGITSYHTASHGGIHVSPARQARIERKFPFVLGGPWYEEDCDWAIVALVFPDAFPDRSVAAAVETVMLTANWSGASGKWVKLKRWLETTNEGAVLRQRLREHNEATAHLWRTGGMSSMVPEGAPKRSWAVYFSRGDERQEVIMPYPTKEYYSDEELEEVAWLVDA